MEPFRLTASQAQAKFKDGSLTVEQYAKSLLDRIAARDDTVHAWAYLNPELVLESARALDAIPPEKRGPLHGVAVGVKDVIYTRDMPTQYNSPIYVDDAPKVDAASIQTLRANGALIFGEPHLPLPSHLRISHSSSDYTADEVHRQNYNHRIRRHSCRPLPQRTKNDQCPRPHTNTGRFLIRLRRCSRRHASPHRPRYVSSEYISFIKRKQCLSLCILLMHLTSNLNF